MKKKIRVILIAFAIVIIIAELTILDYSNLTWSKNLGSYLVIIGMIFTISGLIYSIRDDKKQQANLTGNNSYFSIF
jgi:hypothetical protein